MPERPASVPDLCISSKSSVPNEGVSFVFSSSRASCMATRVASGIWPLVLIHTSVVMECEANSSLPSRHHPLCRLHFPSALATLCDSLNGGWDLFLVPSGWVRRIQLSIGDQFCFLLIIQARPINDHWLWSLRFFSPDSFLSSSSVLEEGWDGNVCIPLVFGGMENSF